MDNPKPDHKQIGVLGPGNSVQARNVHACLSSLEGVDARFVDTDFPPHIPVSLDESQILVDGVDLASLDTAYVHGFSYMNPVIPREPGICDFSLWNGDHLIDQQRYSFVSSLLRELDRRGVELVNPPDVHVQAFAKPALFEEMAGLDLPVPPMICTNDQQEMVQFGKTHGELVWKPPTGRGAWQILGQKQINHLAGQEKPPIWIARLLDGAYVRILAYKGKALACLHFLGPDPGPPERLETIFHAPDMITETLTEKFFQLSGIPWAMMHVVLNEDDADIYDIDPDPVVNWVRGAFRGPLTSMLADKLAGRDAEGVHFPQEKIRRSALFLKQMLWPLYEFERSKRA